MQTKLDFSASAMQQVATPLSILFKKDHGFLSMDRVFWGPTTGGAK